MCEIGQFHFYTPPQSSHPRSSIRLSRIRSAQCTSSRRASRILCHPFRVPRQFIIIRLSFFSFFPFLLSKDSGRLKNFSQLNVLIISHFRMFLIRITIERLPETLPLFVSLILQLSLSLHLPPPGRYRRRRLRGVGTACIRRAAPVATERTNWATLK